MYTFLLVIYTDGIVGYVYIVLIDIAKHLKVIVLMYICTSCK